jgi:hypothetical protein
VKHKETMIGQHVIVQVRDAIKTAGLLFADAWDWAGTFRKRGKNIGIDSNRALYDPIVPTQLAASNAQVATGRPYSQLCAAGFAAAST